jgi:ABC-2 type transport system permease protein
LLPVVSIWAVIRFFAPSFNRKLAMISGSDVSSVETTKKKKQPRSSYAAVLARLFTKRGTEQMSFLFTWKITARSRDFRMKVYPAIGYLFVYVIVFIVQTRDAFAGAAGPMNRGRANTFSQA